jgi:hypothetical protein
MLLMFLAMFLGGSAKGFMHHRRLVPGILALSGASVLIGTAWHLFPSWAGWLALVALIAAWLCDASIMRGMHHEPSLPENE